MPARMSLLVGLLSLAAVAAAAPLSTGISYQGRLADNGIAVSGLADLRFTAWTDPAGGFALGPTLDFPAQSIANGLFMVELGFDSAILDGSDVWLEVEVRMPAGGGAWQALTPRQRLSPAPYAVQTRGLFTDNLLNVGVGTISPSGKFHVSGDIVTTGQSQLRMFHQTDAATPTVLIDGDYFNGSLIQLREASGPVRVQQRGDTGQVSVHDGELGQTRVLLEGGATQSDGGFISVRNGESLPTVYLDGDSDTLGTGGVIQVRNGSAADNQTTVELDGLEGRVSVYANDIEAVEINSYFYGGILFTYDEAGIETARVGSSTDAGGVIELNHAGGTSVGATLDGDSAGAGRLFLRNSGNTITVDLDADGINDAGRLYLRDAAGATIFEADASAKTLRMDDGTRDTVVLSASAAGGGGGLSLVNSLGSATVEIDSDDENDHAAIRLFREGAASATISLLTAETTTTGATLIMRNAAGDATIEMDADFNGVGRVITDELQITGGSDLSEQFDIEHAGGEIQPGMVVAIDPANPGRLIVSAKAYDRTAAGIISGAGGVKPGMYMGQKGTAADGRHPVALTGRVFCYADASKAPIQPGDLLTTSEVPGHAMKVEDHDRAQGAIIGKAMTSLDSGRGLVMVLVSLQ